MELKEYLFLIKKRLWLVILLCIVSMGITAVVNKFFLRNVYEANTSLYVGKQNTDQNALIYNDLLVGQSLVKDYRELAKSRTIAKNVVDQLKLEGKAPAGLEPKELSKKISVSLRGDTRVIEIRAEDQNPANAVIYADKVAEVFKIKAKELMKVENVEIIDLAAYPDKPVRPKRTQNIIIAFFLGLMAGIGAIFFLEYIDNTVKTPEDVTKYLELPVIGTIPILEMEKRLAK